MALLVFGAPGWAAAAPVTSHRITDAGQPRDFEVARDELMQRGAEPQLIRLPTALSTEDLCALAASLKSATGSEGQLVLYERGVVRNDFTRRILTATVLARIEPGVDPGQLARDCGSASCRPVPGLAGGWFLEAEGPSGALTLAETLRARSGVLSAEPQLARQHQKKLLPNDTLFSQQWHLQNTGQGGGTPGLDINVTGVWDAWRGQGVVVGIVDDGIQATHPDLSPNLDAALSTNINQTPFSYSADTHSTAVSGIVAARGNNSLGVAGVAFEATLADIRLLGAASTDEEDRVAMLHRNDVISIKNNSWGATDGEGTLEGPGPLMAEALLEGTTSGRAGRGEIYVFAGGNGRAYGDDVNYDGFANSIHVIAVSAVSDQGAQTTVSEPGACLTVCAPSRSGSVCSGRPGITTTDLQGSHGYNPGEWCETALLDYTAVFSGTSASTPMVAGVAALILQANPALSWRDVKEILLRSATKVSPDDSDWRTNSAGIRHNHRFGAGLVNAGAALALATNWSALGPATQLSLLQTHFGLPVPDNSSAGLSFDFVVTNAGFRVEHAALTLTLPHARFGDLAITLESPGGMVSRLAEKHTSSGTGYHGWTLSSMRHWGEPAAGTWKVHIADLASGTTGLLTSLRLDLHGSEPRAVLSAVRVADGLECRLRVAAAGWRYVLETSSDLSSWRDLGTATVGPDGQAVFPPGELVPGPQFFRARLLPVRANPPPEVKSGDPRS